MSIVPLAFVRLSVGPVVTAEALLALIDILTLISSAVSPGVNALAMQLVRLPLSLVDTTVGPTIFTFAVDTVVSPMADIDRLICPAISSLTMFLTVLECTLILRTVGQLFLSGAVLHIILPEALIFLTVGVCIDTESSRAILDELARVHIAILMMEVALTLGKTEAPITIIPSSIGPRLSTFSVFNENFFVGLLILYNFYLTSVDSSFADF